MIGTATHCGRPFWMGGGKGLQHGLRARMRIAELNEVLGREVPGSY